MITSFTEILERPNFGHITTFTLQFQSSDKIGLVMSRVKIMTA